MSFKEKTAKTLHGLDININMEACERLEIYKAMLLEWNEKMNLTSILEDNEIIFKHFADSLILTKFLKLENAKLIDIGCGAGFPGIPLKLAEDSIKLSLLDSLKKRVGFLEAVKTELGLGETEIFHSRAETGAHWENLREGYNIAVSRAVAKLYILCEYCLPYVEIGGQFIAYKGINCEDEVEEAEAAIGLLGGKLSKVESIQLGEGFSRSLVFIDKISKTPSKFPRKSKVISTKPMI